jgi:hypothetical protein
VKLLHSELDFKLIRRPDGRVGYFDTKTFARSFFDYSQLEPEQVERAGAYNYWGVPAGFVVWFRKLDQIILYSGKEIERMGPGSRFRPTDGTVLGTFSKFDLKFALT